MIPVTLVVAVAQNGVIGAKGALPWHIPEDLKRFKALTLGKPVIMGRKTWDSLPRKPLPGRTNIVVTRDSSFRADGASIAHSLDDALAMAAKENPAEIVVIGGESIFKEALARAARIELTEVRGDFAGDTFMPDFDRENEWTEIPGNDWQRSPDGTIYRFVTLERKFRTA